MTAAKKSEQAARSSVPTPAPGSPKARKAWVPKSPVDVVLDQIRKQEKKVAEMQQALEAEKSTLNKLLQAKKVLEA
jgi:hypothetical protein